MKIVFACLIAVTIMVGANAQEKSAKPEASASVPKKGYQNLNAEEFDKIDRTDTNAVILDVRTKEEYKGSHIPGSVLIDFNSPDFEKEVGKLDKSKTYLVHCGAGGRSARACKKMESLNFSKLYNL